MALTSQNGWPVLTGYGDAKLTKISHIIGKVRSGDVATVLEYLVTWFDQNIEDVDHGKDDWGYAQRPINGTTVPSNHASGTAVDLNASKHPQFRDTFSDANKAKLRAFLAGDVLRGVVRWGGEWGSIGRLDQMHFEVYASDEKVAAAAARIKALDGKPAPAPSKPSQKPTPAKPKPSTLVLSKGDTGAKVKALQAGLNKTFPAYSKFTSNGDGKYGDYTVQVVKEFQRRTGLKADGVVGKDTIAKLATFGINL